MSFEMVNANDIDEVVQAAQAALLNSMQQVFDEIQNDSKSSGMQFDQIKFIIDEFKKKKAYFFFQSSEL